MKTESRIHKIAMVVFFMFLVGCSSVIEPTVEGPLVQVSTYVNYEPLTKSEGIALVVQDKGTYKISENEAMEKLYCFVSSNSENKSAKISVSNVTLKTSPITGKEMYYEVSFVGENGPGFSLLSADERVDGVLCYSEVGSIADTSFNKSLKFCLELVDLYVEEQTKEELDINALVLSANEKLAFSKIETFPATKVDPPFDPNTWTYVGMYYDENQDTRLKTVPYIVGGWYQKSPHNDYLPTVIGGSNNKAYVGCVPLATMQIMSFWQKTFYGYSGTIIPSDWPNMFSNTYYSIKFKELVLDVFNALIVNNPYGSYDVTGTWVDSPYSISSIINFLSWNGFSIGSSVSYSFTNVLTALNYGPTIIRGTEWYTSIGHVWVLDGANTITQDWYQLWTYGVYTHKIFDATPVIQKFVRCRWGWDDVNTSINTWFADGVFSVNPSGTILNFQYDLTMISSIQ